jgi:hypothetical protein
MTTLGRALQERLKKLDGDYAHHRAVLVAAIQYELGGAEVVGDLPDQDPDHICPPRPLSMMPPDVRNQLDAVKAAISAHVLAGGGEFTKEDVRVKLKEMQPDVSENVIKNMSSFLWQLKRDGFIAVKTQGQGHRKSVYIYVKP